MLRRKVTYIVVLASLLMSTSFIRAAEDDTDAPDDARAIGYAKPLVVKDPGATASSWVIWTVLGLLCIGVLFKSGKRTHLD